MLKESPMAYGQKMGPIIGAKTIFGPDFLHNRLWLE
jgi:hypothetical protein